MYNFSLLIDDRVAADFSEKIAVSDSLMICNLEIEDCIEGKNIAELDGEHIERIRNLLILHAKKIVLLNCSKSVTEQEYYKKLFRKAHMLGVGYLNVPVDEKQDEAYNECFRKVNNIGKAYGIGVLVENISTASIQDDKNITHFYKKIKDHNTGLVFNPLEYVKLKSHPFFHEFYNSKLKDETRFLRVNDGLFVDGTAVLPAQGNAEIKELASILIARGYKGYFSFTPYLKDMDVKDYSYVINGFKKLLTLM